MMTLDKLEGKSWSFQLPVFILNRCWLRLEEIKLSSLLDRLPVDTSREAPELVLYDRLITERFDPLIALQECWREFGIEDFCRAQRNSWEWRDRGNNSWTFKEYIALINRYRANLDNADSSVPLLILARQDSVEDHKIDWLNKERLLHNLS